MQTALLFDKVAQPKGISSFNDISQMRFENLKSFSSAAVGFDDARSIYVACFVLAQRQVSSHSHRSATLIYLLKFKVNRVNRVNCFDLFASLTKICLTFTDTE